ncbi:tRNA (cytidine(34)-2'-O)-methyltransferase [Leptospira ryugenii]|uniref:tRNA (cytidine(34)-2'-O)-methyltransferase n=1 Tax=Leptospira ryugenii TaxID=1917863 RepID=UPI000D598DD2|nr:tRNA (cytidine(34)-2'-O)-methyltransferase [Leptospira ryugenii]
MEVALFEPEIPPNTGNIARLCVNAGVPMSIIGEPAFDLSEKAVRRAGLDYWDQLQLSRYSGFSEFFESKKNQEKRIFLISKFGTKTYWDVNFQKGDVLVFGKETSGLPVAVREAHPAEQVLSIPMAAGSRSINLSNSVAIVLYEALRQTFRSS